MRGESHGMGAEAVRSRYQVERDKRMRPDGLDQYRRLPENMDRRPIDEAAAAAAERAAKTDHVTFCFVGAGFAGLVTCARLRQVGIQNIRLIDRAGDVGGAWWWNQYPGAQCDTSSLVYMPLLEETGYRPKEKYARGPEILTHCRRIAEQFDLYRDVLFNTEVMSLVWDDSTHRWNVVTNRGDNFTASYVGLGVGEVHVPRVPDVPGLATFKGRTFHSSRWDYTYTGGDPLGAPLTKLADKRIGVVGTGPTAVQCIPVLSRSAAELFVFQRTPASVNERLNEPIDAAQFEALAAPGWQERWLDTFAAHRSGLCGQADPINDEWTKAAVRVCEAFELQSEGAPHVERLGKAQAEADYNYMEAVRRRIETVVSDPLTAERLKPWYGQFCKRPCFQDDYHQAFNSPTTHLIDTDGKGLEHVTDTGIVANGQFYPLDCIIYASGFETGTPYTGRAGFDPIGTAGRKLSDWWADGMRSLHGIHVHGFPNLFVIDPTQGAYLLSSVTFNYLLSAQAVAKVMGHIVEHGFSRVEVTAEAEDQWVRHLVTEGRPLGRAECTPGRYNYEGADLGPVARHNVGFPAGAHAYAQHLRKWQADARFTGLAFTAGRFTPSRCG